LALGLTFANISAPTVPGRKNVAVDRVARCRICTIGSSLDLKSSKINRAFLAASNEPTSAFSIFISHIEYRFYNHNGPIE